MHLLARIVRIVFGLSWHLSGAFHFLWLLFFPLLPALPAVLSCPGLPSTLGFKPLRASFPSSKSFKAECVWKAVFFCVGGGGEDQSRTEIGTRAGTGGRLWPSLVSFGDEAHSTEPSLAVNQDVCWFVQCFCTKAASVLDQHSRTFVLPNVCLKLKWNIWTLSVNGKYFKMSN